MPEEKPEFEIITPAQLKKEIGTIRKRGQYDQFIEAANKDGAAKMVVERSGQGRGIIHRAKEKYGLKGTVRENKDKTFTVYLYKPELVK